MKIYDEIPLGTNHRVERLIRDSKVFFVASAPRYGKFVNLSPKGLDATLQITGPKQVMFLDVHGSGCETLSHIRENGRVCIMWCAFQGDPLIVRLHGYGRAVLQGSEEFTSLVEKHYTGTSPLKPEQCRSIIVVDGFQVMDSCGYAVPFMQYEKQRTRMPEALEAAHIGLPDMTEEIIERWSARGYSLDNLPGAGIVRGKEGTHWRSPNIPQTLLNWVYGNYQGVILGAGLALAYGHLKKQRS
eukprot:TRINITY_DN3570_c0_g4_i3.p1 TRINITY_DN3570_c0_g4~~TRINITY_DN3570_c0_g4_i3.p1  ORF type:complete len:243 (+),score=43.73 TRINITY_DN3570_c0_g4_i3:1389-2117(+)